MQQRVNDFELHAVDGALMQRDYAIAFDMTDVPMSKPDLQW